MRLFIAIEFPEAVKDSLYALSQELRAKSKAGNFTRRENLHLTMAFLGETERANDIRLAMERTWGSPFELETGQLGRFRRDGGDIWWLGLETIPPLIALQKRLADTLRQDRFYLDERDFRPHLTLGRQVAFPPEIDRTLLERKIPPLQIPVDRLTLMKSERIGPRLVYTPIYQKPLSDIRREGRPALPRQDEPRRKSR